MLRPLRIVDFNDVHNGHSTTPTSKIAEEIRECFPYGKWASSIDILCLAGDWYDKLLPNNHPDNYITESSMFYLLRWCKDHDIVFLIVDGTPLHDAGQIKKFIHINNEANINADVILADDIDIVYLSKFDINVLFVPDRPRTSPEETYNVVIDKLMKNNIDYVDLAVMHGCFQYQLPKIASDLKHKEENYINIVKGPIIIGHIHSYSSYKNIIAPGSFSRLSHGEEEPKGFIEIILNTNGEFKSKFIENKSATIYKTINVSGLDLQEAYYKIKMGIFDLPEQSRVRIECEKGDPISLDKSFMHLKLEHVDFLWSIKVNTKKDEVNTDDVFSQEDEYIPLIINKDNIAELIINKASDRGYSSNIIKRIPYYLKQIY